MSQKEWRTLDLQRRDDMLVAQVPQNLCAERCLVKKVIAASPSVTANIGETWVDMPMTPVPNKIVVKNCSVSKSRGEVQAFLKFAV